MSFKLLSSPLQGFTDYKFRNLQHKYFGGIDTYYAPYIRLKGKMEIKPVYQKDLDPKNNHVEELIPQVITNSPEEFVFVAEYVKSLGYKEINWNLGCPYPMVAKKSMGSGLICQPQRIDEVLDLVHSKVDITVSMKMRMGYEHNKEIMEVFPILEKYPIKNIAIHARIGKQLYKGGVDWDGFEDCIRNTKQKLYYNGDITTVEGFNEVQARFPSIDHWMIGRGLIGDPFLPTMIKEQNFNYPEDRIKRFETFHKELYEAYDADLSGPKQTNIKMHQFWEYFSQSFVDTHKGMKKIKKAKNKDDYFHGVKEILQNNS